MNKVSKPSSGAASGISSMIRIYLVPAAVFQSVIVGGGYGTGREVVEFLSSYGPTGGLFAIGVVILCMAAVLALTFEIARLQRTYDYRHFFKTLIGRGWIAYEALFLILLTIILAVVLSAASTLLFETFGIAKIVTIVSIIAGVTWAVRYGSAFVERILSVWAVFVTAFLVIVLALMMADRGGQIFPLLFSGEAKDGWSLRGAQFAFYNLSVVPVLLYAASDIATRKQAIISGMIAGFAGALPALVMHLTFLGAYPQVLSEELPMYRTVRELAVPGLLATYVIILFGTIVQTSIGVLQGFADRLDGWLQDKRGVSMRPRDRALLGGATLIASSILSAAGIISLVAKGYGALAWGFLIVYIAPLFTIGLWRVIRRDSAKAGRENAAPL